MSHIKLISFDLCPYVQRAAISLAEKSIPFERVNIDLSNKPDWFLKISPTGKVPILLINHKAPGNDVNDSTEADAIFESNVILEYLEDTQKPQLHPENAVERAKHRSWIEFGSAILNRIGSLYNAKDQQSFDLVMQQLRDNFARLEDELDHREAGPYFDGSEFSLVDAVYGPIFRYFDVFETVADLHLFNGLPKIAAWRAAIRIRPSVQDAVNEDYTSALTAFLQNRQSVLSTRIG